MSFSPATNEFPPPLSVQQHPQPKNETNDNINWNDYNFPPLLLLWHYDLSELSDKAGYVVHKIFIQWIVFISVLGFNFINTIVLVADHAEPINVLYTILNFAMGSIFMTYIFYCGNLGIGQNNENLNLRFMILQGILGLFYLLFVFFPLGPVNGWVKIADLENRDSGPAKYGIFAVVVESLVYMALVGLAGWCIYMVKTEKHKQIE